MKRRARIFKALKDCGVTEKMVVRGVYRDAVVPLEAYLRHLSDSELLEILSTGRRLFSALAMHGGRCQADQLFWFCFHQQIQPPDELDNFAVERAVRADDGLERVEFVADQAIEPCALAGVAGEELRGQPEDSAALKFEDGAQFGREPGSGNHRFPRTASWNGSRWSFDDETLPEPTAKDQSL